MCISANQTFGLFIRREAAGVYSSISKASLLRGTPSEMHLSRNCKIENLLLFFDQLVRSQGKTVITTKYIRGTIVVITLLLAAAANLMDFSYDADHDETTPPVVVEFHFIGSAQQRAPRAVVLAQGLKPVQSFSHSPARTVVAGTVRFSIETPPQRLLPLLC
jgi:hypothetical protein